MSTATVIAEANPAHHSIGRLCELLKCCYDDVRLAIELAGVTPSLVLDRIEYFDVARFEAIKAAHERRQAEREEAAPIELPPWASTSPDQF